MRAAVARLGIEHPVCSIRSSSSGATTTTRAGPRGTSSTTACGSSIHYGEGGYAETRTRSRSCSGSRRAAGAASSRGRPAATRRACPRPSRRAPGQRPYEAGEVVGRRRPTGDGRRDDHRQRRAAIAVPRRLLRARRPRRHTERGAGARAGDGVRCHAVRSRRVSGIAARRRSPSRRSRRGGPSSSSTTRRPASTGCGARRRSHEVRLVDPAAALCSCVPAGVRHSGGSSPGSGRPGGCGRRRCAAARCRSRRIASARALIPGRRTSSTQIALTGPKPARLAPAGQRERRGERALRSTPRPPPSASVATCRPPCGCDRMRPGRAAARSLAEAYIGASSARSPRPWRSPGSGRPGATSRRRRGARSSAASCARRRSGRASRRRRHAATAGVGELTSACERNPARCRRSDARRRRRALGGERFGPRGARVSSHRPRSRGRGCRGR